MGWLLLVFVAVLTLAIVAERLAAARAERCIPPPGRLIEVGGRRVHVRVMGEQRAGPAVVLESGLAASSLSWHYVQPAVAEFARVTAYDRPGFGWSQPRRRDEPPISSAQLATEVRALLGAAGVPGPYIVVAHSFGAYIARCFAEKYPGEVAGIVMVDPLTVEEWRAASRNQLRDLRRGVISSYLGAGLARIGFVRLCLKLLAGGSTAVPRGVVRSLGTRALELTARLTGEVRKLPPEVLPQVRAMWSRSSSYVAMAQHLRCLPRSAAEVAACAAPSQIPVTVISAGNAPPERRAHHAAFAEYSQRGKHIIAEKSGHWIHFDEPQLIVEAIREMVPTNTIPEI